MIGSTHRTPGRSCARPPLTSTTLCSWRLCPSPGMYAWRTFPDVSLTRATLRFAELGFLGFAVNTCMTMPFRWGLLSKRGALDKAFFVGRLLRIAWLSVLRVGAEEWNVLLLADAEQHGRNTGNVSRGTKGVRNRAGRERTLNSENIACTVLRVCNACNAGSDSTWKTKAAVGMAGVCRLATRLCRDALLTTKSKDKQRNPSSVSINPDANYTHSIFSFINATQQKTRCR